MKLRDSEGILQYATQPHIEIIGNSECTLDGVKGIPEYHMDRIKINLGKQCVTFRGDRLYINCFSEEGATIKGTIIAVEFCSND